MTASWSWAVIVILVKEGRGKRDWGWRRSYGKTRAAEECQGWPAASRSKKNKPSRHLDFRLPTNRTMQ